MLSKLLTFYEHYPSLLFQLKNVDPSSLSSNLLESLEFHGQRQSEILSAAQFYMLDEAAQSMLYNLAAKMEEDGLEDMFSHVKLPFPAMLLTVPITPGPEGMRPLALITQDEDTLYTQVFFEGMDGFVPNLLIFKTQGTKADVLLTPTYGLTQETGENIDLEALIEQEKPTCFRFLGMVVGMSVLFKHKAMLETEEVPLYPRAERRRAQKMGKPLPDTRVVKVSLGELGKRQAAAMLETKTDDNTEKRMRRAHWVQGHFMRNRGGGISWRNPHIRGAGPVIEQERHVSAGTEEFE
ncbi:hypothetical protein [Shimia aestuarii]|uniref:hypothetical protein n=1 Tax=Shimia aestuarii TaxID=254406 RepID=UPI001FB538F7|nr:hypothetical protein [Shimia aestuarii]